MHFKAELLDEKAIARTLKRISHEIIEKNKDGGFMLQADSLI
jgi:pyrimidine operon attenuation protein/uracil phosphoribosyltransferase